MYDDFLWEEMQANLALSSETASWIHHKTEAPLTSTKTIFSQYQDHYFLAHNDCAVTGKAFAWRCCKCSRRYKFTSADGFSLLPFPHAFIDCMASQGKSGLPHWYTHTHTSRSPPEKIEMLFAGAKGLLFQVGPRCQLILSSFCLSSQITAGCQRYCPLTQTHRAWAKQAETKSNA